MSTTMQTPITKEGIESLGFEMIGSNWHVISYSMGDSKNDHLQAEYWDDDDIRVFAVRPDELRLQFTRLKTIEQLKTIIEVCL